MILKFKPTPKRNRMAVILASRHENECYFCGNPRTICVDTVEIGYSEKVNGKSQYLDGIQVRHKCTRHRMFGHWPKLDNPWGWPE